MVVVFIIACVLSFTVPLELLSSKRRDELGNTWTGFVSLFAYFRPRVVIPGGTRFASHQFHGHVAYRLDISQSGRANLKMH